MTPLNELECKCAVKINKNIPACKYPNQKEILRILRNNYLKFTSKINPRRK